ncbi:LuxR C-terminal-related transcriptional regulator [Bradyrhizobium sp. Gha]|uniref:LuxR C-terminal-related transcriptional regulator n=1 Tax=Bradyrhizobium sp. Gha TaxID=1855318 RepID=UPI0015A4F913|nr:LuxR C-terminal-related transcriptional regulator [Bradyrhizobium sp. Gha]
MAPIRLVIADRRPIVLQGFDSLFAAERDFAIVASCLDGAGCLKAVRTLTPDLVLVEDGFSDVTASDLLAIVKAEHIPTRLVFYTASVAHGDLAAAIAAGSCCAISMREEPETLVQSLRLVAPTPVRTTAGRKKNGALGEYENGAAALTNQERKIMRLVAYGMSNKQIARQLNVSPEIIKARLDHISAQLEIRTRAEMAVFALSRLYGGIGALAALLYAALDDVQPANAAAFGHEPTDTFTMMTPDGSAGVITLKISPKTTTSASDKTARSLFKGGRIENSIAETPARASKAIQSSVDSAFSTITLPSASSARPALSSFGSFMMTAAAVWISDLLNSVVHASNVDDSLTVLASATGSGTGELATPHSPVSSLGSVAANLDSPNNLAWWHPETDHQAFAFVAPLNDTLVRNDDTPRIIGADARDDGAGGNGNPHVGSGFIDAPIDHGGFEQVAATGVLGNTEHDGMQASVADESNPAQSQQGSQGEDGGEAAKQDAKQDGKEDAKQDLADDDSTHGQSQRDLNESKDGPVTATQHSKHDTTGGGSNPGQTQPDLHGSQGRPAGAGQHADDEAKPAGGTNSDQSHRESHQASQDAPGNPHASLSQHAGADDPTIDNSRQAHKTAAPELGDSFHFKNENAASGASDVSDVHGSHAPDFVDHGPHTAGNDVLPPVQASDLIGPPGAEQAALHHAHAHDLFL